MDTADINRPMRVLVVDDEPSIRSFAVRVLQDAGYAVDEAADGYDALSIVDQEGPFDLFVIDVVMPHLPGDELARRLRQRDPDVNVLYFTGHCDRLFEERNVLWEHEAFVEKPLSAKGLLEAMSLLLFGHTRGLLPGSTNGAGPVLT